jgi:hypothetical protein
VYTLLLRPLRGKWFCRRPSFLLGVLFVLESLVSRIELVTVDGLQFKKYQIDLIKFLAQIYNTDKLGDVNQFIMDTTLTDCVRKIRSLSCDKERDQLSEDGYKDIREKVIVLSGASAEVLLDNIVSGPTGWSYEFTNESVAGLSVVGVWRRTVRKVSKKEN